MPRGTFPAGEIAAGIVKGAIVIAVLQTGDTVKGTSPWSSSGTLEWENRSPWQGIQVGIQERRDKYHKPLITKLPFVGSTLEHIL